MLFSIHYRRDHFRRHQFFCHYKYKLQLDGLEAADNFVLLTISNICVQLFSLIGSPAELLLYIVILTFTSASIHSRGGY